MAEVVPFILIYIIVLYSTQVTHVFQNVCHFIAIHDGFVLKTPRSPS